MKGDCLDDIRVDAGAMEPFQALSRAGETAFIAFLSSCCAGAAGAAVSRDQELEAPIGGDSDLPDSGLADSAGGRDKKQHRNGQGVSSGRIACLSDGGGGWVYAFG